LAGSNDLPQTARPAGEVRPLRLATASHLHDRNLAPLDIIAMRYAVLTVETSSFARAATIAGVKQATLSRSIAGLESRVGLKLFDRTTHGARPTEIGLEWLNEVSQALTSLDALYSRGREIGAGRTRKIGVGFSTSLAAGNLKALLGQFRQIYPDLHIHGFEGCRERLSHALHSRTIDFAVLSGGLLDTTFKHQRLWSERVMAVVPDGHALCDSDRIYWSDLRRERLVLSKQESGGDLASLIRARLSEPGWQPNIEVQDMSRDNVVNLVSIGGFVSLTTDAALGRVGPGATLREVFDASSATAHIDYVGCWRSDNQSWALARLLEVMTERHPA
jgi:DNA-binding transcriptional LysR family regulator